MSRRKINTKQLTAIRPIINHGRKQYYFRYYCPDRQKDGLKKFAGTESEVIGFDTAISYTNPLGAAFKSTKIT